MQSRLRLCPGYQWEQAPSVALYVHGEESLPAFGIDEASAINPSRSTVRAEERSDGLDVRAPIVFRMFSGGFLTGVCSSQPGSAVTAVSRRARTQAQAGECEELLVGEGAVDGGDPLSRRCSKRRFTSRRFSALKTLFY